MDEIPVQRTKLTGPDQVQAGRKTFSALGEG